MAEKTQKTIDIFNCTEHELCSIHTVDSTTATEILVIVKIARAKRKDISVTELYTINNKVQWQDLVDSGQLLLSVPMKKEPTMADFMATMNARFDRLESRLFGSKLDQEMQVTTSNCRSTSENQHDKTEQLEVAEPEINFPPPGLNSSTLSPQQAIPSLTLSCPAKLLEDTSDKVLPTITATFSEKIRGSMSPVKKEEAKPVHPSYLDCSMHSPPISPYLLPRPTGQTPQILHYFAISRPPLWSPANSLSLPSLHCPNQSSVNYCHLPSSSPPDSPRHPSSRPRKRSPPNSLRRPSSCKVSRRPGHRRPCFRSPWSLLKQTSLCDFQSLDMIFAKSCRGWACDVT